MTQRSVETAQPISWPVAVALLSGDIIKNTLLRLLRPDHRTRQQVASEYDQGDWARALADQRWSRCATLEDYLLPEERSRRRALIDGRLVSVGTREYYRYRAERLRALLADAAAGADEIVEVGCGTGTNVLTLAADPRWRRLSGYDISPSGIAVARACAAHFGLAQAAFDRIDLTDAGSPGFAALAGQVVFSYYCMEQLRHHMPTVLANLRSAKPRRVVHIEPTLELWSRWRLRDLASRAYTKRRDYQDNLLSSLRGMERDGTIRIFEARRLHFAPTPRYDPTLVVWEPA
jgi:SAM-dependent methyltransferase